MTPDAEVLGTDGTMFRVRTLRPDDGDEVVEFYEKLDDESRYRRFMTRSLPPETILRRPLETRGGGEVVLGIEDDDELLAVGMATRSHVPEALDVAFAVLREHQGRGLGTLLLELLAAHARDHGVTRLTADTLRSNRQMLGVFERVGFSLSERVIDTDVEVVMELDDRANDSIADRDSISNAASLSRLLRPTSVAVVGASDTVGSVGHALFENVLNSGFSGTAFAVNPGHDLVQGQPAYRSVADLPDPPQLAVIAVPSAAVADVLRQCGDRGVAGAVVISAGFAEVGDRDSERDLLDIARDHGMRLIGPNCVGVVNSDPAIALNATFSPAQVVPGSVGFASQSGALGIAVIDHAARVGLGVSTFVSLGNKADVSGNDLLQYWQHDPSTTVAAMYLESFGNPRKFAALARRFCRTKPLVVVKGGRSASGKRAASSHTAALAASDDIADALFADAGIIRVDTLTQLFDACRFLVDQPVPTGMRVAIVGNSGGPGILAADACEAAGLVVPTLADETQERLRAIAPAGAAVANPVDLIASAPAQTYEHALAAVLEDDAVDAVLVIYTDPMVSEPDDVAAAISRGAEGATKPIVANFLAADVSPTITSPSGGHRPIPVYDFPEDAAAVLARAGRLGVWRAREDDGPPIVEVGTDREIADAVVEQARADLDADAVVWMNPADVQALLAAWKVPLLSARTATDSSEAVDAAAALGTPVALKLLSDTVTHKTDVGGVVLGLETPEAVALAFDEMKDRLGEAMTGALVQAMADDGIEVLIGALADPVFGPVVMFGTGGTEAEVWADRAVALAPLSRARARELIGSTRISRLLEGYRGSPPVDVESLVDIVVRVGAMFVAHPELVELDLNPVIASPDGVSIPDARLRVGPAQVRPSPHRRLMA